MFDGCTSLTSVEIPNSVTRIERYAFRRCSEILIVYCYAEKVPSTYGNAFDGADIEYATLYVPANSIDAYNNGSVWSEFGTILPISEEQQEEKEKCAKPSITFKNGELTFSCMTENASIDYNYSISGTVSSGTFGDEVIKPEVTLTVNAWAKADGFETSDTATAKFDLTFSGSGNKGDVNEDGTVNISDVVKVINIMAGGD